MLLLMILLFESASNSSELKAYSLKMLSASLRFGLTVFMVILPCWIFFLLYFGLGLSTFFILYLFHFFSNVGD